ncbi:hypothetical protein ACFWM3_06345 [Gottfriedia sp. NPDC058432]|uniref:hypothetical protein n=1 Tax=Gottfriedia sp. NPDC058432 TaxID=3346497 RepID=UPI00364CE1A9
MNNFSENELKYCLELRRKLFEASKSLVNCDLEERKLYEELCILYSTRLKALNINLKTKYGIILCACQKEIKDDCYEN